MERTTLATALLCLGTAIAYADELTLMIRLMTKSEGPRARSSGPGDLLSVALSDLAGPDSLRAEQAAAYLRVHPSREVPSALMSLLSDPDTRCADRAAAVLRDRGDPEAAEALYGYLARRSMA